MQVVENSLQTSNIYQIFSQTIKKQKNDAPRVNKAFKGHFTGINTAVAKYNKIKDKNVIISAGMINNKFVNGWYHIKQKENKSMNELASFGMKRNVDKTSIIENVRAFARSIIHGSLLNSPKFYFQKDINWQHLALVLYHSHKRPCFQLNTSEQLLTEYMQYNVGNENNGNIQYDGIKTAISAEAVEIYSCVKKPVADKSIHLHDNRTNTSVSNIVCKEDKDIHCLCRKEVNGIMIRCDDSKCVRQWFHLACMRLEQVPEDI